LHEHRPKPWLITGQDAYCVVCPTPEETRWLDRGHELIASGLMQTKRGSLHELSAAGQENNIFQEFSAPARLRIGR